MNKINLDRNCNKIQIRWEELKVFCVKNTGDYYTCYHSEYISNYKAFVKLINLEISRKTEHHHKETTLSLLENVTVYWSTSIHMKLLLLVRDMKEFLDSLVQELDTQKIETIEEKTVQNLKIMAQCECHIEISQDHKAKISLGQYIYLCNCLIISINAFFVQ